MLVRTLVSSTTRWGHHGTRGHPKVTLDSHTDGQYMNKVQSLAMMMRRCNTDESVNLVLNLASFK